MSSRFKYVVITGASHGIGAELSLVLAEPGVTLGLFTGHSFIELEEIARKCRHLGASVYSYHVNVVDQVGMRDSMQDFIAKNHKIDLVIVNAGIAIVEEGFKNPCEVAMENMQVNFFGAINTIAPTIEIMKQENFGQIAIISSISSLRSTQNSGPYSASKAAINLWAEGLRLSLKNYGVGVSILRVGFVKTRMTSKNKFWMPGIVSADYAAKVIINAIKKRKIDVALPWQSAFLWKVFSVLPDKIYDFLMVSAKSVIDKEK
jgi:short-subunit dehydrogenase